MPCRFAEAADSNFSLAKFRTALLVTHLQAFKDAAFSRARLAHIYTGGDPCHEFAALKEGEDPEEVQC